MRESFSRAVHGRSVSSIKNYWQRQISSNRAEPPPEVSSDAEVVAYVRDGPTDFLQQWALAWSADRNDGRWGRR